MSDHTIDDTLNIAGDKPDVDWSRTRPVTNPELKDILENEIIESGKIHIQVDLLESYWACYLPMSGKNRAIVEKIAKDHYQIRLFYSTSLTPKECVIRSICHEMGHIYHGDADKDYRTEKVMEKLPSKFKWTVPFIGTFLPFLFNSGWYVYVKEKRAWKYARERLKAYNITKIPG
jgi:hypothetical protein